jgi:RimJ/RimL family protein N-acetyltransferase
VNDHAAYAAINADPEVMRFINGGVPLGAGDSWKLIAMQLGHWQMRGYGPWAVEHKASSTMIGSLGFWFPEGWPGIEVGWRLHRAFWGLGLATEGAEAAVRYGFDALQFPALVSVIHPGNHASIRVAEKLGMRFDHLWRTSGQDVKVFACSRGG